METPSTGSDDQLNRNDTVKRKYGSKPSEVCVKCNQTVYPVEKLIIKQKILHRNCLRCAYCNKLLDPANYATADDKVFCKPHFTQLYNVNGDYTTGFQKMQELKDKEERERQARQSAPEESGRSTAQSTADASPGGVVKATVYKTGFNDDEKESDGLLDDAAMGSELLRRRTVRDRTTLYEKRDVRARAESTGEFLPDDYDENGNVKRKSVLNIDSDEQSRMKRVGSWDKLKGIVSGIESNKHRIKDESNSKPVEPSPANNLAEPEGGAISLRRAKTLRQYGQKPTETCDICTKLVYPVEKITVEKKMIHSDCLKCVECGKKLSLTTYNAWNGQFYCKPHFQRNASGSKPVLNPPRQQAATSAQQLRGSRDSLPDREESQQHLETEPPKSESKHVLTTLTASRPRKPQSLRNSRLSSSSESITDSYTKGADVAMPSTNADVVPSPSSAKGSMTQSVTTDSPKMVTSLVESPHGAPSLTVSSNPSPVHEDEDAAKIAPRSRVQKSKPRILSDEEYESRMANSESEDQHYATSPRMESIDNKAPLLTSEDKSLSKQSLEGSLKKLGNSQNPLTVSLTQTLKEMPQHNNDVRDRQLTQATENVFKTITIRVHRFTAKEWITDAAILQKIGFDFTDQTQQINEQSNDPVLHLAENEMIVNQVFANGGDITHNPQARVRMGDILLEVNGRRTTNMKRKQVLRMIRELLQPLPPSMVTQSSVVFSNTEEGTGAGTATNADDLPTAAILTDPSIVALHVTLFSRLSGIHLNYSTSSGRFLYSEVHLQRVDPVSLIKLNSPWMQQSFSSSDDQKRDQPLPPPPETVHSIHASSPYPYFTFEVDLCYDPSFTPYATEPVISHSNGPAGNPTQRQPSEQSLSLEMDRKGIPRVIYVSKIKPVAESLLKGLGGTGSEAMFTMLPPIYRCLEGEIRVGDMVWKVDQEVYPTVPGSTAGSAASSQAGSKSISNEDEVRRVLKSVRDRLKKVTPGETVVLGVVVRNKLHPTAALSVTSTALQSTDSTAACLIS